MPSAKADSICSALSPGTAVPGFLVLSLRDWGVVCPTVFFFLLSFVTESERRPIRACSAKVNEL